LAGPQFADIEVLVESYLDGAGNCIGQKTVVLCGLKRIGWSDLMRLISILEFNLPVIREAFDEQKLDISLYTDFPRRIEIQ
jgi:hypothetical protein